MDAEIDWQRIADTVEHAVQIACSNKAVPYDDEYVSIGYDKALYAVKMFNPELSKRGVYEFVKYAVIRTVKLYIRLAAIRNRKFVTYSTLEGRVTSRSADIDASGEYGSSEHSSPLEPAEDRLDPLGSAMLMEFAEVEPTVAKCIEANGRVTQGKTYKKRKTWLIAKMRKERLKREYDEKENQTEGATGKGTADDCSSRNAIEQAETTTAEVSQ